MEDWKEYELQVVRYHQESYRQTTWHQEVIPEHVYFESGYIHNWNKHRLGRIMKRRETKRCALLPDYGLDFISHSTETGTYHGGQVKLRTGTTGRLTASECASFINCVFCRLKTTGYLYTSTTKLEVNLKEDILASNGQIEHIVLPYRETNENGAATVSGTATVDESLLTLRPYQQTALDNVFADAEATKTLLRLTTGTGKTVIAGNVLARANPNHIVCIAPLLFSVSELQTRLQPFLPHHHVVLMDCEGTTDPDFVRAETNAHDRWVIFSTFKSFEELLPQLDIDYESTYLLIDEVHNCLHRTTLCDLANRFTHSLYLSATVQEELQDTLDYEEAFSYNIRDAINDGNCVDYEVFLPYMENEELPDELGHIANALMCNKVLFLATGMLQEGKRRCVVYLPTIEEALAFERVVKEVFETYHGVVIDAFTIHCDVPKAKRQAIVDAFCTAATNDSATIKIICNVRIFNEAINLVPCDCVYKTEPGKNDLTTVQQLGRAIRLDPRNPSKKAAMFVWCLDWDECVDSLQRLKQEDPEFHAKLRIQTKEYDRSQEQKEAVLERARTFVKYVEIKCLSLAEVWEKRRQHWITQYQKRGIKTPSQHSKDPEMKRAGQWQQNMRTFYKNTIENKKGTKLSEERIAALNATEGWKWDSDPFQENLDHWITQYQQNGNKTPSKTAKDPEEKRAGQWQGQMRNNYKNTIENKKGPNVVKLSEERIAALNATKGWKWGEDDPFQENLDHWITQYRHNGNNTPIQHSKDLEEKHAGQWQSQMRQNYKNTINNKKGTKLSEERIATLNATKGWKWEEDDPFQENLNHWITQYQKRGIKKPSQSAKDPDKKRAGQWQNNMRQNYKNTIENKKGPKVVKLSEERIATLNSTEGWEWDSDPFQENLDHWITQYQQNGNKTPSHGAKDPEMKRAATWQSHMRKNYKKKVPSMTQERIAALTATEGWKWDDDPFQDNLDHWITHYQQNGNQTPSQSAKDPEEKRAAKWQSHMREGYKNTIENKKGTKLSEERIAALNATEGWKWEEEDPFQENLDHWITQYQKRGNKTPSQHAEDPAMKRAAQWQGQMRKNYKNTIENKKGTKLSEERIAALNATEGWKWSG